MTEKQIKIVTTVGKLGGLAATIGGALANNPNHTLLICGVVATLVASTAKDAAMMLQGLSSSGTPPGGELTVFHAPVNVAPKSRSYPQGTQRTQRKKNKNMKSKIIGLIGLIGLMAGMALGAQAQTNTVATNAPPAWTTLDQIIALVGSPTNYAVAPYATYAPNAPSKWGGGIMGVYDVNQNVGLGLGLDWLGSFSLVNANLTLQAPFHPLPSQLPSFVVSPFVLAGAATPYSGDGKFNGTAVVTSDFGAYLEFGHLLGGEFGVGGAYGRWSGAGPYDVPRYHGFLSWEHGF